MKRIIIILLITIFIFSMSIIPVNALGTLELYTQALQQVDGNICTIQYWTPDDNYRNVVILESYANSWTSTVSSYQLVFYKDTTKWGMYGSNYWMATETVYYRTFSTYAEAIEALFTSEATTEYTAGTAINYTDTVNKITYTNCVGSYPKIALYQSDLFANESAASLEVAYYDWYVETYNKEPEFITQTPDDEIESNSSGIIAVLEKVLEALTPNIDISFVENVGGGLDIKLKDNNFYKQVIGIKNAFSDLFNQNYRDPRKFNEINPLKITLRRPVKANEDGTGYTYSGIDYGLNDVSLVGDMRWFFGTHYDTGDEHDFVNVDGSFAVKYYTDRIISAFMWLMFGWYLWHNLPDLIGGEIGAITGTTKDVMGKTSAGTTTITTTTDMNTGETKTIKTTKKRG